MEKREYQAGTVLVTTLVLMVVLGVLGTITLQYATKGVILGGGIKRSVTNFYSKPDSAIFCLLPELNEKAIQDFILPYCLYAGNDKLCTDDNGMEFVKTDFCSSRQDICSQCNIDNVYVACPGNNGGQRLARHSSTGEELGKEGRFLAGFILLATFPHNKETAVKIYVQAPMRSLE